MLIERSIKIIFDDGGSEVGASIVREEEILEPPEDHFFKIWSEDFQCNHLEMLELNGRIAMKLRDFLNELYPPGAPTPGPEAA